MIPGEQAGSSRVQHDGLTLEVVRLRAGRHDVVVYDRDGAVVHRDGIELVSLGARIAFAEAYGAKLNGRGDVATIERMLLAAGEHQRTLQRRPRQPVTAEPGKGGQAQRLVSLVEQEAVFRAPNGETTFATVSSNGHREVWPIQSKGFRRWLSHRFYSQEQHPPSAQALADALGMIDARARFAGDTAQLSIRVASDGADVYLDLANDEWGAVRITPAGWEPVATPPVYFRRPRGSLALPQPERGGSIDELRRFVNIADADWPLFIAWVIACFRPHGPDPVLTLHGDHGAAKSTAARVARRLVDPNTADLRAEPRDLRDLAIFAHNSWCIALDNLSRVPLWLSDAICRLSTGAGFSTRELYADLEETLVAFQRPVIVNGIEEIITRPDLLDRAVILYLPSIDEKQRLPEAEFWAKFEAARPRILGALLDAVSIALRNAPTVRLSTLPRMADFAIWSVAAEPALGLPRGAFLAAYEGKTATAHELALEASPIGELIGALISSAPSGKCEGTAKDLLAAITALAPEAARKAREFPKTPKAFGNALRRIASNLRATGVVVTFHPPAPRTKRRVISLMKVGEHVSHDPPRPPEPPELPAEGAKAAAVGGVGGHGIRSAPTLTPGRTPADNAQATSATGDDSRPVESVAPSVAIHRDEWICPTCRVVNPVGRPCELCGAESPS